MKFLLVGLVAALASQATASKYYSDPNDLLVNSILQNYGNRYRSNNVGLGGDNQWTGESNRWIGDSNRIRGSEEFVVGNQNDVDGRRNNVKGNRNQVKGEDTRVEGENNQVSGSGNVVVGSGNIVRNTLSSEDFDTDSWFPDWMKQTKTTSKGNAKTHQAVSKNKRKDDFDMNFPDWMNNDQDFWTAPTKKSSRTSKISLRSPDYRYNPYPTYPNYVSNYERSFRYPYATSYHSQPTYYTPWNSWQQFYEPQYTKADFFRSPYQTKSYHPYLNPW